MKYKYCTRTRILKEAYLEFRKRGYIRADLGEIVKRAGVTKGALYYYFKSKEDLANNVIDHEISARIDKKFLAGLSDELDINQMLARLAASLTNDKDEFGTILVKFANEIPGKHKESLALLKDTTARIIAKLSERLAYDESIKHFRNLIDPVQMAQLIFSVVLGSLTLSKVSQNRFVVANCLEQLGALLSIMSTKGHAKSGDP